jgi:penicillin amidase
VTTFVRLNRISKPAKILIGISATLIICGIAAFFFFYHLITKSYPVTQGALHMEGLHEQVDVYRDPFGIPHINAHDEHDLMMAVGYVQAQDRLWQMDLMRRAGQGRLAEILGDSALPIDRLFRTLDFPGLADRLKEHLHPESKTLLENYATGINAFIANNAGKFPVEFDMLNYRPEPWKIEHSLLLSRLMAWELSLAWWTDLTYGEIASKVSLEKLQEIIPVYSDSFPVTVPSAQIKKSLTGLDPVLDAGKRYCELFGLEGLSGGSNGWAVDSSRSMTGKPLLANDPHLGMPAPSRWYEMHLSAPGWNVSGVSVPGVPLIVIGHNDHVAWGLTAAMIDDADFYIEKIDSLHPDRYFFQKSTLPFSERVEKIYIGSRDSIILNVRSTIHGPVINDIHPVLRQKNETGTPPSSVVTMRWTGFENSDEVYGFYGMDIAKNKEEFAGAIREITVPAQSVVYADDQGTIASWTAGRVPIRGKQNAMLPLPGWTGDAEWHGFIPFEQLPHVVNPREGFIACANQKLADQSYPYYLSTLWEPPSRIQRIRQLLSSTGKLTIDDFKQFQQDVYSPYARDLTNLLLHIYDTIKVENPSLRNALTYLRNWDYRFTTSDIATTIINTFMVKLLHNTYEDEMGPLTFEYFVFFNAIPYRVTSQLLSSDSSSWWDNVTTPERETRNDIVKKSFSDAIQTLEGMFGPDMKTWQWGTVHTVTFNHPFGKRKPLDKVFNIGPFPVGGGGTCLDKTEFRFLSPYSVAVGPSMRFIVDMSQPEDAFIVNTTGESGQPFHQHYNDQTPLWLNGGYVSMTMNWGEITAAHWDHMVLEP